MPFFDTTWYCNAGDQSTTGYYAVTKWAASVSVAVGALRRQLAVPPVGAERVYVCIVAGTTGSTEPSAWNNARGGKTTDNTVTWQEVTGISSVNGDAVNTVNWTTVKGAQIFLGTIIKRNSGTSYQICTASGFAGGGAEPAFSDTAGATVVDNGVTWTSLGVVGNFTGGMAPHARLNNVFGSSWFAAGNTVYVGDNHAESQSTLLQIAPSQGNATVTGKFICHNHSGSYPPASGDLTTGATITGTGGGVLMFNGTPFGGYYFYGITFVSLANSSSHSLGGATSSWTVFERCSFQFTGTVGNFSVSFTVGNTNVFNNTTMKFANANGIVQMQGGTFIWQNTSPAFAGSFGPSGYLLSCNSYGSAVILEALDLSLLTGPILNPISSYNSSVTVKDCKLSAALTASTITQTLGGVLQFVRSSA